MSRVLIEVDTNNADSAADACVVIEALFGIQLRPSTSTEVHNTPPQPAVIETPQSVPPVAPVVTDAGTNVVQTGGEALEIPSLANGQPQPNTAPAANTTAAVSVGSVELDASGLPWDARIHSSNHKQSSKGIWQKKRGVTQDVVNQVTAELRAANAPAQPAAVVTPAAQTVAPAPSAPAQPEPVEAPAPSAPVVTPDPVQVTQPAPVIQPVGDVEQPEPAPQPAAQQAYDWGTVLVAIQNAMINGKYNVERMKQLTAEWNVEPLPNGDPNVALLAARSDTWNIIMTDPALGVA